MSRAIISPAARPLTGELFLPGDKSIAHRRALLSLFTSDPVRLENFPGGLDCQTTLSCLQRLGKRVEHHDKTVIICGEFSADSAELDCGNSGTTSRLLMGILAGREGEWILTGDASLSRRPMERVAIPLRLMGAQIEMTDGHLPARIHGTKLRSIEYDSPLASAQVKSAVFLAALQAEGITRYREPSPSRDHTERLLKVIADNDGWIAFDPQKIRSTAKDLSASLPGDPSTAAFWIAAALIIPQSEIMIKNVLANPRRSDCMNVLKAGGAKLSFTNRRTQDQEDVADVTASHSTVTGLYVNGKRTPNVLDEVPLLAALSMYAANVSEFFDLQELRMKESDRVNAILENLRAFGAKVYNAENLFGLWPSLPLHGATIRSFGDHRIALAFSIAALGADSDSILDDAECIAVSYPEFWADAERLLPGNIRRVA
jgi:3-phosphoshikimate 1-carboxyvinyltransferase